MRTVGQQYFDRKFQSATPALMTEILLSVEGMDDDLKLVIATMIEENKLDDARLALSNWHYKNQARG
jgi:hypothetical protein